VGHVGGPPAAQKGGSSACQSPAAPASRRLSAGTGSARSAGALPGLADPARGRLRSRQGGRPPEVAPGRIHNGLHGDPKTLPVIGSEHERILNGHVATVGPEHPIGQPDDCFSLLRPTRPDFYCHRFVLPRSIRPLALPPLPFALDPSEENATGRKREGVKARKPTGHVRTFRVALTRVWDLRVESSHAC
jgi:hypothetical protein